MVDTKQITIEITRAKLGKHGTALTALNVVAEGHGERTSAVVSVLPGVRPPLRPRSLTRIFAEAIHLRSGCILEGSATTAEASELDAHFRPEPVNGIHLRDGCTLEESATTAEPCRI